MPDLSAIREKAEAEKWFRQETNLMDADRAIAQAQTVLEALARWLKDRQPFAVNDIASLEEAATVLSGWGWD